MKPFAAPLDDILFILDHVARATDLPGYDPDLTREIAGHFATYAEEAIAPLDEPGDRQGCRLEDGRVRMPDGFPELYRDYAEQGWQGLTVPEEYGGQGLDATLLAVTSEIFTGANHSLQMVTGLVPGAVRTLLAFGTEAQKEAYVPPLASGEALATMCLTEPGAGSDLSRVRCKAVQDAEGWRITGEKIFISGGDQDMSARILHLVLARTSDDGTRGLSLFLCPCTRADGSRNAISVTRIEEKTGLHASPTCQLVFDDAEAELIGMEGAGLKAMFTMMNHARADVALQGVAHAARATDIARAYAAERIQGRGPDGAPVTLDAHADVARMLDEADALALGGRAIAHLATVTMERGEDPDLVEILTPIAKVYCTEAGIRAADLGIQVLGGYGYLSEYRVEQTWRDARITAIYEGANGIHSRSLVSRLLPGAPGDALERFLAGENCAESLVLWRTARQDLTAREDPSPAAHDFMALSAEVLLEALWNRILGAADSHPDPTRIRRLSEKAINRGRLRAVFHAGAIAQSLS
ncbi:acyl-CoA dehydrogenase family protein [Tropicimonas sp. IMCC6043]|uniref:acyl-CoA dehydrogenase family protein n=1 Tax=Tropicimonas sp. IMCC6043 TaxID=2510645 RepID=UPI00101DA7EF|nr:acyl-CoA dehydrogenase family protein [Tropicimonas sp. IMCC6043]RYH12207.1 acyl-CoA dehydrogenase [Tropicimonas sp. IMCC6043]